MFEEILSSLKRNKLRTALTGFAVAWGIFMLIVLLGAGNGLVNATEKNTGHFLSNSMMVGAGRTTKAHAGFKEGRHFSLDMEDVAVTERLFTGHVEEVTTELEKSGMTATMGSRYVSCSLTGVYPAHQKMNKIEMYCGRFINEMDMRQQRKCVVVSNQQMAELAGVYGLDMASEQSIFQALLGRFIKVGDLEYMLVGVYKGDESGMSNEVYLPFSTMRAIYGGGDKVDNIVFTFHGLDSEKANEDFEMRYRGVINTRHQAAADDEGALWIWNRFTQSLQMSTGMSILKTALWIIGLLTLLSGVVGVSNIMLITVKERTHEFGIRKAIGATPFSILKLIITESVFITLLFGYVGMLLGILATEYMDSTLGKMEMDAGLFKMTTFENPTVDLGICIGATITLVIAGTLAGIIPARKASITRPVEALRG